MIKFPTVALAHGLRLFVNAEPPEDIVLRLYFDDSDEKAQTVADIVEPTGNGYAPITIPGAAWVIEGDGGNPSAKAPPQSFRFTGALGLIRGYFMTRGLSGALIGYERFAGGAFFVENNGDTITVSPVITWRAGNV